MVKDSSGRRLRIVSQAVSLSVVIRCFIGDPIRGEIESGQQGTSSAEEVRNEEWSV
jgi:hypothetical protein